TEGVVRVQRKIETGKNTHEAPGCNHCQVEPDRIQLWIERGGIDHRCVVDVATIEGDEEGCFFGEWAVQVRFDRSAMIIRFVNRVRISRVESSIAKSVGRAAVKRTGAGPGKDLNIAKTNALELSRERILIDHDL